MILVDTQTVAWLAFTPAKLSPTASRAIADARREEGIAIAAQTLWELAMMESKRKIEVDMSLREFLEGVEQQFTVLPIDAAVAARSVLFGKVFPKDPADRIIAATALVYGLKLVTADEQIRRSGEVPCIW
jgi:PIN domain nuclease of toxin-antitoxin system